MYTSYFYSGEIGSERAGGIGLGVQKRDKRRKTVGFREEEKKEDKRKEGESQAHRRTELSRR